MSKWQIDWSVQGNVLDVRLRDIRVETKTSSTHNIFRSNDRKIADRQSALNVVMIRAEDEVAFPSLQSLVSSSIAPSRQSLDEKILHTE